MLSFLRCDQLNKGAIGLVLDIAAAGFPSVRHLCSACLHSVPGHTSTLAGIVSRSNSLPCAFAESMPDPDNPAVLDLIMCLLDADGKSLCVFCDPMEVDPS